MNGTSQVLVVFVCFEKTATWDSGSDQATLPYANQSSLIEPDTLPLLLHMISLGRGKETFFLPWYFPCRTNFSTEGGNVD